MSTTVTPAQRPPITRGRVIGVAGGQLVFCPAGTNYEHHLAHAGGYDGPIDRPVMAVMHVRARKVYSVPSGGSWVAPILGTPRIVQGRVMAVAGDGRSITLQAGGLFVVDMPTGPDTIDLNSGAIATGKLVNVVAMPGASIEMA